MVKLKEKYPEDFEYYTDPEQIEMKACELLWLNVLLRLAQDACYRTQKNGKKNQKKFDLTKYGSHHRKRARAFIDLKNSAFRMVCRYAGKNPKYVYEKLQEAMHESDNLIGNHFTRREFLLNLRKRIESENEL